MERMITILGPTACGKTRLATVLASRLGGEVISADSRQVYRGMDIGTGKDLADYVVGGLRVPCHLIDVCEAGERYNLFRYQQDFHRAYADICGRGALPILCGGTGLYIESVLRGYRLSAVPQDPSLRARLAGTPIEELTRMLLALKRENHSAMHNRSDVDTPQRAIRAIEIETYMRRHGAGLRSLPPVPSLVVGLAIDREARRERITRRLQERLEGGMADEIRGLIAGGVSPEALMYYGLEYRYVTEYVTGLTTYGEMFERLETAIHQFAKRQMTWFRGMERRGTTIHWIDALLPMEEKVERVLSEE